jgi:hypothetical protein
MEIKSQSAISSSKPKNSDLSIEDRVKAKFGGFKKSGPKIDENAEASAQLSDKSLRKAKEAKNNKQPEVTNEEDIKGKVDVHPKSPLLGDFTNDPNSDVTREKLKGLVVSGSFSFNDKERETLKNILK